MTPTIKRLAAGIALMSAQAYAEEGIHRFNIPAQSLVSALQQLSAQSGAAMLYAEQSAAGKTSPALQGDFTLTEAVRRLLTGSGLTFHIGADGTVTLKPAGNDGASTLGAVTVTANAFYDSTNPYNPDYTRPTAATATKTDTALIETPFSVKVIPQQVIEDQQGVRLERVLQNVSGVTREPAGNLTVESFNVRGFQSFYTYRDGLRMGLFSPRKWPTWSEWKC
ncbi:secretin and TonB N-terminal domain-containing protein [Methylomonas sp. CM2]|uniref:STN domain-containing protein n=1 Tax=Methylomonas sp. CM2 TaxID=3417647 RepID=UPI003CF72958